MLSKPNSTCCRMYMMNSSSMLPLRDYISSSRQYGGHVDHHLHRRDRSRLSLPNQLRCAEAVSPAPRIWPHGGDLSTIRVLSRLGRTEENFRGRYGKSDLAFQAVARFQLSHDVRQESWHILRAVGGRCAHQERVYSIMKHFALEKIADKQ